MQMSRLTQMLRRRLPLRSCGAVIVAAGNASRMGGVDKIMADLLGEPVIARTVRTFENCEAIREIVVVTREDLVEQVQQACAAFGKVKAVVPGGSDRPASVTAGLAALSSGMKLAAIHDGARPMVTVEVIDRTVRAANTYGAAAPAIPVKDTVKVVQGGLVASTPDRSTLQAVQTPQVFDADLLRGALQKAAADGVTITDDCSAVEHMGMSVKIVAGDERNMKITTPLDLRLAQLLMEEKE